MQEKLNQLSLGEKLLLVGAVIILIASFFNWAEASASFAGISRTEGDSGWGSPGSIWSVLRDPDRNRRRRRIGRDEVRQRYLAGAASGLTWGMVYGAAAALVILLMLLKAWRILALPDACAGAEEAGIDCSIGFAIGYWIALIGAIIFAAGGYMLYTADKGAGFSGLRSNT